MFIQASLPRKRRLSMTPLIDVVFILLLFFMLASSFIEWREIDLSMAGESAVTSSDEPPVVIQLSQDDFLFRGESMSLAQLLEYVASELASQADLQIVVQPQANVPLQKMVMLLDQLRVLGAKQVSLLRAPTKERG